MNCCPNCFSDSFLQDHIRAVSKQTGTCSFCKTENINLDAGESVELQVSAYDTIGEGSKSQVISATAQQIGDIAKFAQKLRPPELVDSLPILPAEGYPESKLVVLKSNKTMYQNINGDWDDDFDIEGLNEFQNIIASTVIAGAIGAEEANIREILTEALETKDLQATLALIEEAYINDANIRNLSTEKINSGKLNADIVKLGKQVFKTTDSSPIESTAMPGITIDDEEVTDRWDGHVVDGNGERYYDKNGNLIWQTTKDGEIQDKEQNTVIDINGYNGQIAATGLGFDQDVLLSDYTVPDGWFLYASVEVLDPRIYQRTYDSSDSQDNLADTRQGSVIEHELLTSQDISGSPLNMYEKSYVIGEEDTGISYQGNILNPGTYDQIKLYTQLYPGSPASNYDKLEGQNQDDEFYFVRYEAYYVLRLFKGTPY